MANKTRRTRVENATATFSNAAEAKTALAILTEERPKLFAESVTRAGKVLTLPESLLRRMANTLSQHDIEATTIEKPEAAKRPAKKAKAEKPEKTKRKRKERAPSEVDATLPRKTRAKTKQMDKKRVGDVVDKLPDSRRPKSKAVKRRYTVLTPATRDAKKLATALTENHDYDIKVDGARAIITSSLAEAKIAAAVVREASALELPIVLESGFDKTQKLAPKTKAKTKRPTDDGFVAREKAPWWRVKLDSSTLVQASYNPLTEKMIVTFKKGSRYRYSDVSVAEFTMLATAESHGSWFASNIKGVKKYVELDPA